MNLEHTRMVTPENGPRPAGKPTECFYCHQPLGEPHKDDCLCFTKIVMVKVEITIPKVVPVYWTKHEIEFHMNDSSWCASNIVNDLERMDEADEDNRHCLCNDFTGEFLRDATAEDLDGYTLTKFTDGR